MPEGVEHISRFERLELRSGVQLSVMPEGVEHTSLVAAIRSSCSCSSMMPEGVEHVKSPVIVAGVLVCSSQ